MTGQVVLLVVRGLPGSGKTTFARTWVAQDPASRARVNRDDLRAALFDAPVLTHAQEEAITTVQRSAVTALLRGGRSVVVDDTHLRAKYVRAWAVLAGSAGAGFEVHDVVVPVDVAVERDAARLARGGRGVGEAVIRNMAARFMVKADGELPRLKLALPGGAGPRSGPDVREEYVPPPGAPTAWLADIDGTLARMTGRGPYEWARVGEDEPVPAVVSAVAALHRDGHRIIVMSGRDGVCRPETEQWLSRHRIPYDELHMRAAGNTEQDAVIKRRLFDEYVRDRYAVVGVLDDRDQVVTLWRSMGLACFQVAPGAF